MTIKYPGRNGFEQFTGWMLALFFMPVLIPDASSQCVDTANFNDWIEPLNSQKIWVVDSPKSVTQEEEQFPPHPSFFLSERDYLNVKFSFDVISNNSLDDDFIGFVMGYRDPFSPGSGDYKFVLLDWKAGAESAFGSDAQEGFTLTSYTGYISPTNVPVYFWGHYGLLGNASIRPLAQWYGSNRGWAASQSYHFDVWYTNSSIIIDLDGTRIFDVSNCNNAGRIGFYTYSQHNVTFTNFSWQSATDFISWPDEICAGDTVFASIEDTTCPGYNPAMQDWRWYWGDGSVSQNLEDTYHAYDQPGNYTLRMVATFPNGCQDSVTRNITVQQPPVVDLGPDTLVPPNSSITLVAGPNLNGWSYRWSTGSALNQLTIQNVVKDTTVSVVVTKGLCQEYDEITIGVTEPKPLVAEIFIPNAFSPNGDGLNEYFKPVFKEEIPEEYIFLVYNRWGAELFRSEDPGTGWDGRHNNATCPGEVYVYLIHYQPAGQTGTPETITRRGNFLLLR